MACGARGEGKRNFPAGQGVPILEGVYSVLCYGFPDAGKLEGAVFELVDKLFGGILNGDLEGGVVERELGIEESHGVYSFLWR